MTRRTHAVALTVACLTAATAHASVGAQPAAATAPASVGMQPTPATPPAGVSGTVLVMPTDSREAGAETAWVAYALAETLPRDLGILGVAAVQPDERRRALEVLEILDVPATLATAIRVAEALGATRLVSAGYTVENATLKLSLRVTDVERGTLSAPFTAAGPLTSLRELIHGLAWDLALSGPLRPTQRREELFKRDAGVPFAAYRAYCEALRPGDAPARLALLRRALALAPGWDDAELALGELLLQTREFAPALQPLAQVTGEPGARRAQFLQALALYELGRYAEAATLWSRLARATPAAGTLNNLALARLRASAGTATEAERPSQLLRAAVELEPGAPDLAFNLGWVLLFEDDAEAAVFWLRGRVREDHADAHARLVLAWALRRAGHAAEADAEWHTLAELAPGYEALAAPDFGRRFERLRPSETAPTLDHDSRSDAELAATHAARGERLLETGDTATALGELTRAAYLDPYSARVHRLLARAQSARGERQQALTELRMSLWCREDPDVRLELATLLRALGRTAEARRELERLVALGHAPARALLEQLDAPSAAPPP